MLFSIRNQSKQKYTHAGVLEFIAPEGRVYLPPWMMNTLLLKEGDLVLLKNVSLPLGNLVKIQPQSVDFLDITDPRAVLENAFRNFTTLTIGDVLAFKLSSFLSTHLQCRILTVFCRYGGKVFKIEILEVKPEEDSKGISIIETDLSVDFAPPVGYVEPSSYASSHKASRETSIMGTTPKLQEFVVNDKELFKAFAGTGNRLKNVSGLTRQIKNDGDVAPPTVPSVSSSAGTTNNIENQIPAALVLPEGRLFFGYPVKLKKKGDQETDPAVDLGPGYSLRAARTKKWDSCISYQIIDDAFEHDMLQHFNKTCTMPSLICRF